MYRKLHHTPGESVFVEIDGIAVAADANESVATVLLRQKPMWSRTTTISEAKRAPYCMMGVCFECLAFVDGASVQTCMVKVRDGMRIERQLGRRRVA
jgi:succinate dehydrogenase/fumarate reductase-like Fe-S protein